MTSRQLDQAVRDNPSLFAERDGAIMRRGVAVGMILGVLIGACAMIVVELVLGS